MFRNHTLYCLSFVTLWLAACRQQPKITDNTREAWYKEQVIYNLDIKTFLDTDSDGIGDINGLTSKLSYLDSLGVTMLWLAPFQPSPLQDDGYDVTDYLIIDPRLGTQTDFQRFLQASRKYKIKVIMDVVLNHSSINHPWFRTRPDWYLWSEEKPSDWDKGMGFPVVEKETWRLDSISGKYFFHRFYHFQPDLNYQNSDVVEEAKRTLVYWLDQGVDGFRLDAVPFIIDDPRNSAENPEHDFSILHELALAVRKAKPEAVLLGEANVEPEETKDYFSKKGEGLDMMLNFEVNEYLFYAFASGDAKRLKEALEATAEKPPKTQWVYFLRNHDEVDLGKLSKNQMQTVYDEMGPDTTMQLYERGIRRRLAPMLNNSLLRLKQAYALGFVLPGTLAIRYGEEIGMGDDLSLKERLSVRTPMQWNNSKNGGFSESDSLIRPVIAEGEYGYPTLNVSQQLNDGNSLLVFTHNLLKLRKKYPEISQGRWDLPETDKHCLIIRYYTKSGPLLAVFNFSDQSRSIKLPGNRVSSFVDVITNAQSKTSDDNKMELPPYAGYWLVEHIDK